MKCWEEEQESLELLMRGIWRCCWGEKVGGMGIASAVAAMELRRRRARRMVAILWWMEFPELLGGSRFAEMACLLCLTSLGSSWGRKGGACG